MRLFVARPLAAGAAVALPPAAARHAQVRRVQPGDSLTLFDGSGGEWAASVVSMGRRQVVVEVEGFDPVERELALDITLAVGMPANERMDWLVEKATELGVTRIVPLRCERSVLRLAGERALRKREHWQSVAAAACEQCGRNRVPMIDDVLGLADALALWPAGVSRWLLSLNPDAAAPRRPEGGRGVVFSGPEGGFTPAEEELARRAGCVAVGLGRRVLRAETAPLTMLAWLALL